MPFIKICEAIKGQGDYPNLAYYIDTKNDYLTDTIISIFETLRQANYNGFFLKAVMVEAGTRLSANETAYRKLWKAIGGDEETLPEPAKTPETPGTPERKNHETVRYNIPYKGTVRKDGQPLDFIPRVTGRPFVKVYEWLQKHLEAFDVIFEGQDINFIKNKFVDLCE